MRLKAKYGLIKCVFNPLRELEEVKLEVKTGFKEKFVNILNVFRWDIFLSIICVLVCLFISNHFWINIKPLHLNIELKENENASVSAFLLKRHIVEDGSGFGEIRISVPNFTRSKTRINIVDNKKVIFDIDQTAQSKVTNIDALKDFRNDFYISEDGLTSILFKTNEIRYTTFENVLFLVYKKPFTLYSGIFINYCILIIISFFSFVFAYMIFSYLFRLNKQGKNPLNDIFFVFVFCMLLLIPASRIDKASVSVTENRELAPFPKVLDDDKLNNNFGKSFEKWFNDRFFGRALLNNIYHTFESSFSNIYQNDKVIVDKEKGVFTFKEAIKNLFRTASKEELEKNKNDMRKFAAFCKMNNIKLYYIVIPDRASIYPEDVPNHNVSGIKTFGEQFEEYIKNDDLNFDFIFPKKLFLKEKENPKDELFFKTDAHQTDYGGYVSYTALMKVIKNDYPKLKTVSLSEFNTIKDKRVKFADTEIFDVGNTNKMSLNSSKYLTNEYTYYVPKENSGLVIKPYDKSDLNLSKAYYPKGELKVMLIGSSFIEKLYPFLRQTFKYTDKVRVNNPYEQNFHVSRFTGKIEAEKPEIIVLCFNESEAFQYMNTMYDETKEVDR